MDDEKIEKKLDDSSECIKPNLVKPISSIVDLPQSTNSITRFKKAKFKKHKPNKEYCNVKPKIKPPLAIRIDIHKQLTEKHIPDNWGSCCLQDGSSRRTFERQKTKRELEFMDSQRNKTASKYFCQEKKVQIPCPQFTQKIEAKINLPSTTNADSAPVKLQKASPDPSFSCPFPPDPPENFLLKKPKSGIFVNIQNETKTESLKERKPKKYFKKLVRRNIKIKKIKRKKDKNERSITNKKRKPKQNGKEEINEELAIKNAYLNAMNEENLAAGEEEYKDSGDKEVQHELIKQIRRKVPMMSCTTSYQSKDINVETKEEVVEKPISKGIQKFRRDSEIKRYEPLKRKFKRGTLESHSFTDIQYQPVWKKFFFGSKSGFMHQGDIQFSQDVRDNQGICIPVAAYCYSILKHPNLWTSYNIDDILKVGSNLYLESAKEIHMHPTGSDMMREDLQKFCYIGHKKIRFMVDEPEVTGFIRTNDRRVFNLTKGLNIFFSRQKAGILQSCNTYIAIWKDKYYYFFDGKPRTKDLFISSNGTAMMAVFYDITSIVTVLLKRSNLGNSPYVIYTIKAFNVLNKDDDYESATDIALDSKSNYNIVNENKAVLLGSFELADKCFDFARNKQALAMAVVCLVYSRITPPSSWHRSIIDKIMIIGNQLYLETIQCNGKELVLENLPAIFTIGPYIVEIYIYANRFADVMYTNCNCMFAKCIKDFFKTNCNGILQIAGKYTLAVWKQRNIFFCFDPYSRNNEGFHCRDGAACVSMHSNVDSLIFIITNNFECRDNIFYLHSLKVCKIHRDPIQSQYFPKLVPLSDIPIECLKQYKLKKSKKNATSKPTRVDCSVFAIRQLLAGETPDPSILEIGSTVESIALENITNIGEYKAELYKVKADINKDSIADLDDPVLSDTQIEPPLPIQSREEEEIEFMDLDTFELTQDEKELQNIIGEGENERDYIKSKIKQIQQMGEDGEENGMGWYYATSEYSQVKSESLATLSKTVISDFVNTELTYFPIERNILYPTLIKGQKELDNQIRQQSDGWDPYFMDLPHISKSEELAKITNFIDLPDNTQLIRGTKNLIDFGQHIEFIAPFVCIMAGVVSKKYSIYTWSSEVVDYVLKCGVELYKSSKIRYDQVAKLEIPKVTLGKTSYRVLIEYVFDTYSRQNILEVAIEKILFVRSDVGVLVTPTYACTLILKNHLYYLFDAFGNNEVGLSEGASNQGVACLARFKSIHDLATRIMYNKRKRESLDKVVYTRFVLSSVRVQRIQDWLEDKEISSKDIKGADDKTDGFKDKEPNKVKQNEKDKTNKINEENVPKKEEFKVGYHFKNNYEIIEGSTKYTLRHTFNNELKEDHFACIIACLTLLMCPIQKWDTRKVNKCLDYGKHIYSLADDLDISEKRSIKNILIGPYFIDIIVKKINLAWSNDATLKHGINTLLSKKMKYFLIQLDSCYAVYVNGEEFNIFDCYGISTSKRKKKKGFEPLTSGWIKLNNIKQLLSYFHRVKPHDSNLHIFYTFEITSIRKAPKHVVMHYKMYGYKVEKKKKDETIGKPFHEDIKWLETDLPWNRLTTIAAGGHIRGDSSKIWNNWDVEYENDLYSLVGSVCQRSPVFSEETRGKQTLCNLIVSIGMTLIYQLEEWNSSIIDSILVNGDQYLKTCIADIKDANYELGVDDLKEKCHIFPFEFKVILTPVVEGIMFIQRVQVYNLFKALRLFFLDNKIRYGLIIATKGSKKRMVSFGKTNNFEYFMFDPDCYNGNMFPKDAELPYVLRMTNFNRLIYVLAMTLTGGEFYIWDVCVSDINPM